MIIPIFSEINKSIFVLPHEGTCTLWLYTCTCTVRKYLRILFSYESTFVLSYFRTSVLSYFRTFVLSYFRTFVLYFVRKIRRYELRISAIHITCKLLSILLNEVIRSPTHVQCIRSFRKYTHGAVVVRVQLYTCTSGSVFILFPHIY